MSIFLLGNSGIPFDRTFFNTTLEGLVGKGSEDGFRLTLFLTDGTSLELCKIEELASSYIDARAYRREDEACDVTRHLIPYSLIYRIEIAPKSGSERRLGFHWSRPITTETARTRRSR